MEAFFTFAFFGDRLGEAKACAESVDEASQRLVLDVGSPCFRQVTGPKMRRGAYEPKRQQQPQQERQRSGTRSGCGCGRAR